MTDFWTRPEAAAALLSAVATIFAAIAAIGGPLAAAKMAERLRRDTETSAEAMRLKMYVFTTLMQERARISSPEGVRALNMIDIAFLTSAAVRDAWSQLHNSFDGERGVPAHVQAERLHALLSAMAKDLSLSNDLRSADLDRVYYPNAIARKEEYERLFFESEIERISGKSKASPIGSAFPPRPAPSS